jgi:anti-sigma factor RsiW
MREDRLVAGLFCTEVLARLSDYLDDELSAQERSQVEDHLRGCEACTRFGGEFSRTVGALRHHLLGADEPLPSGLRSRLLDALERAPDAGPEE